MRQGMRGFNSEAMQSGHSVRDGHAYETGADTGEVYDLVVVGAGMAGLSADMHAGSNSMSMAGRC